MRPIGEQVGGSVRWLRCDGVFIGSISLGCRGGDVVIAPFLLRMPLRFSALPPTSEPLPQQTAPHYQHEPAE